MRSSDERRATHSSHTTRHHHHHTDTHGHEHDTAGSSRHNRAAAARPPRSGTANGTRATTSPRVATTAPLPPTQSPLSLSSGTQLERRPRRGSNHAAVHQRSASHARSDTAPQRPCTSTTASQADRARDPLTTARRIDMLGDVDSAAVTGRGWRPDTVTDTAGRAYL
jgi:hypothetical protein